jgi:alkylation response protein AidB-like acyl-CoA dehydrogenase
MDRTLLNSTFRIADEIIRPRATDADLGGIAGPVKDNLRLLASKGYLGLGVPRDCGGLGADETTQYEYTEILAAACGVTAFTQQQLRTGIKFIVECQNEALKCDLLPRLATGQLLCGIAISQLRRGGKPMLTAEPVDGGYRLNGTIPWITAWSALDGFVVGAAVDGGERHLLAYVDMEIHKACLTAGAPLPLVVMGASDTVQVAVSDLVVPIKHVLQVQPNDELPRFDDRMITTHTALPLGCARASERYLRDLAQRSSRKDLEQTATALMFEINHCRREALTWNCDCVAHPDYKTFALRARAGAIVLAMRAAHAAVAAGGGGSQLATSEPQRLIREAQFYTTAVQTPQVQSSVLDQLFSPFFGM